MAHDSVINTNKFIKWMDSKITETHESEYEAKESGDYIKASFAKHEREIYEYIQKQMFVDCTKGYKTFMEEKNENRWHDLRKNKNDLPPTDHSAYTMPTLVGMKKS